MTAHSAFETLLGAVRDVSAAYPDLGAFVPIPAAPAFAERDPNPVPVISSFAGALAPEPDETPALAALRAAFLAAAPFAHWKLTYTEEEVGADFLANYGWFELVGPDGHFFDASMRVMFAYWGPGLDYAMHEHEAEELYLAVSGEAAFRATGDPDVVLRPGMTRLHKRWQPHAMITREQPILALILWRGGGMSEPSRLSHVKAIS